MNENKTYRCIAVDDEPHALELLGLYINKMSELNLVHSTTSPLDAVQWLKSNAVDLIFLDIQMNDLTGLQLLSVLNPTVPVILTTAYSEYALESYEYKITDYLLKPYSFDRFYKAVQKAIDQIQSPDLSSASQVMIEKATPPFLFVKGDAKNKYHRIKVDEIKYIEGVRNYVHIICIDQKVLTLQNLKTIEESLPTKQFVRAHKSYIVNLDHVDLVEGNSFKIGDQRIPIGRNYKERVLKIVKERSV